MKKWWRKIFPPLETFTVQLHVNSHEGVVFSYEAIAGIRSLEAARSQALRLRLDNRWASYERWPLVTIHNNEGEWFPESKDCWVQTGDNPFEGKRWEGR